MTDHQGPDHHNKLSGETSTYLLQHAHNPVDWYPWGEEAIERARAEDKPILLSVGYSACHWCHVMAHESFEDESTAALMNKYFINIKVDREERTDIDEIYMKAVQLLAGNAGWPMTVFLTGELKPFYAGTYFPPEDRFGMPSFQRVLLSVVDAWLSRRSEIEEASNDLTRHLNLLEQVGVSADSELTPDLLTLSFSTMLRVFDRTWGGFGGAPKFPHTASISLALRLARSQSQSVNKSECLEMVTTTLERMARGGIHDQIGGGFARYSVDHRWLIPHFEKMLYDNALIARNYFDAYLVTGRKYFLEVGRDTLDFVLSELLMPEGGFYCSLDADSEGEEGKFYVWTREEILSSLGQEDGSFFCDVYGVTTRGNFEDGRNVLHFSEDPSICMKRWKLSETEFWNRLKLLKARLLEERERRSRPGRDNKMLTSWTALMISALLDGYRVSGEAGYLEAACRAANFILDKLVRDGRLLRTYGKNAAKLNGYLDDYAYTIQALLDLSACDSDPRWFLSALTLNDVVLEHFSDNAEGGFFYTSDEHEKLIARTRQFYDGSTPSASSVSVMNLIRLGRATGKNQLLDKAAETIKMYVPFFVKAPDQFSNMLCALDAYLERPLEIAAVFDNQSASEAHELLSEIYHCFLPNAVIMLADKSLPDFSRLSASCPLVRERSTVDHKPAFYICSNFICRQPVTSKDELLVSLGQASG